jgi:hypothetical protein
VPESIDGEESRVGRVDAPGSSDELDRSTGNSRAKASNRDPDSKVA